MVYAALGTAFANNPDANAVYRCENPTDPAQPIWLIGDPGKPQNQIDWISITNPSGAGGSFNLILPGVAKGQTLPPVQSGITWTNPINFDPGKDQSAKIAAELNSLLYITQQGGAASVVVTQNNNSNGTTNAVYDITFTGTLGLSPQPLVSVFGTNQLTVNWNDNNANSNGGQPGGGADNESNNEFPSLGGNDGNIKLSTNQSMAGLTLVGGTTVFASVSNQFGNLRGVYVTQDGGHSWAQTGGQPANYMNGQGNYDNTIIAQNDNVVYVGGSVVGTSLDQQLFGTTDGGATWKNLSLPSLVDPHTSQHAMFLDPQNRLLVGDDGGIFRFDPGTNTWSNLNGDLAISQMNGVAPDPTDVTTFFGGVQSNGTVKFSNQLLWDLVDKAAGTANGSGLMGGGQVYVDPNNPNNIYAVQRQLATDIDNDNNFIDPTEGGNDIVRFSGDGGATWSTIFVSPTSEIPMLLDSINSNRLLIGGAGLHESVQQGAPGTYVTLFGGSVTAIAAAEYQGNFVPDVQFPDVSDRGANTYDPDTIYITDGTNVFVTKDHAVKWVNISVGAPFASANGAPPIGRLVVDPTNRDTVFALQNTFAGAGAGQIYVSSDATFDPVTKTNKWVEVGTALGLPPVPVWSLVVDPRNGNLYAGTDIGVFTLKNSPDIIKAVANGAPATGFWQRFGEGMPNVQVKELVLNQTTNTLLAGTYGRSAYELFLNGATTATNPVTAALTALSGTSEWTGPVTLGGDATHPVTFGADGNSAVQNPLSTAQLNLLGTISDQTANGNPTLFKRGLGFIELSGPNTYGGVTDIVDGALIANNLQALGDTVGGTIVAFDLATNTINSAGAALQLASSVDAEPLTLYGDGPGLGFNGHNTGALQSIANNNTYAGPITLETDSTIGVSSKSTLEITGQISDNGGGRSLTKELTGTLILDETAGNANSYTGITFVNQGALQIASQFALSNFSNTVVLDGAQIQLQTPTTGPNAGNPATGFGTLTLSGTGINNSGALLDTGGTNTWEGNIVLDAQPGFSPISSPGGLVAIGVSDPMDMLFIGTLSLPGVGIVSDDPRGDGLKSGLAVVGAGTVVLTQDDTYSGGTYVKSGTLRIQDPGALGGAAHSGLAQNEIQRLTLVDPSFTPAPLSADGTFTLQFGPFISAPLSTLVTNSGLQNAIVSLLQQAFPTLGVTSSDVAVAPSEFIAAPIGGSTAPAPKITEIVYTIIFQGILAGMDLSQLLAAGLQGATATVSTVSDGGVGARVENGGTLALDLGNAGTQTVAGVALQLNGNGAGGVGALDNVSGDNTWQGPASVVSPAKPAITLSTSSAIGVETGTTLTIGPDANGTPPIAGLTTASLTKVGPGTLALTADSSYQGNTYVRDGVLSVSTSGTTDPTLSALGAGMSNEQQTLTITGSLNGTFSISLGGMSLGSNISANWTNTTSPTTLDKLTAALAGIATVTQNKDAGGNPTNIYTVVFDQPGTAGKKEPLLSTPATAGTTVAPAEVIQGGLGGTIVNPVAGDTGTLELTGSITYSTGEVLTLNGNGFDPGAGTGPLGALYSLPSAAAANVWDNPTVLASNAAIGVDHDPGVGVSGLVMDQTISESGGSRQLTKLLDGTLELTGNTNNTNSGVTTVADGTLLLNKAGAAHALGGDLTVGVPGGTTITRAQLAADGQFIPSAVVTVNTTTGLFDVNNKTTTIGKLVTVDGNAQTGDDSKSATGGTLNLGGLDMTGGVLDTESHGIVNLGGTAKGTSDATTGFGIIKGGGTFSLGGATRTFDLTQGVGPVDMDIQMPITGTAASGLLKAGTGTLELDADSTASYLGLSTVQGGFLQVDGKINDVALNGGIVSGVGTIGNIKGSSGAPSGGINPGDNGVTVNTGILTTTPGGTETWGSNTKLLMDINNPNDVHPNPTAGLAYDQLVVNGGTLNLGGTGSGAQNGGATLDGTVGVDVNVGDRFTIIQAVNGGTISGRFAEPFGEDGSGNGIAFIGGIKFLVLYSNTTVVVQRALMTATLSLTSTLINDTTVTTDPSVYGQPIQFVANMVAEAGAGAVPTSDTVTFTLKQGATVVDTQTVHLDATGKAVYDPQAVKTYDAATYTVTVAFNADPNFTTPAPVTHTWQLNQDATKTDVSVSNTKPVIGETVVVTAKAIPQAPGDQTAGAKNPTGNMTFTIGGVAQTPVKVDSAGAATFSFQITALGNVAIVASYGGDVNYVTSHSSTTSPLTVTGQEDNSTVTILANPTSPSLVGETITFKAVVTVDAPGSVVPASTDLVKFTDTFNGSTVSLGNQPVQLVFDSDLGMNAYEAVVTTSTLALGAHSITAVFTGDNLLNGNTTTIPYAVNLIPTATTLTTAVNPAILAQQILFTATVAPTGATGPGSGQLSGTVNFYDASVTPPKLLGSANVDTSGQALFTYSKLAIGSHSIYATYSGNTSYAGDTSTNTISQTILYGDTTTVTSSLDPSTYGDTVVFTITVAPVPGTPAVAGIPDGTVDLYDGGTLLKANIPLDSSGVATFSTASLGSPLAIGSHTIIAYYNNSTNQYITSQGSFAETVRSATKTTLAASANPTGLGLDVTFTATVAPVAPGQGNPDGKVTFTDGTTVLATVDVDTTTGLATFTTNSLTLGTHPITASYAGSNGYAPSASTALSEKVIYADSTDLQSSLDPSPLGGAVTFTATVKPASNTPGGINPTGTVTFYDGATALNTAALKPDGTITYMTSALAAGAHAITAVYNGNANFITTTSQVVTQNVLNLTKTAVATSKTPTVYSEPVKFTVTVTPTATGQPVPTGTVTLYDGSTSIGSGTLSNGRVTITPAPLSVGKHQISAVYSTSSNFYTSTSTAITQTINQDGTSISVTSSSSTVGGVPTSVYSEPVSFTAQVLAASPGTAIPTGTVTFFDGGKSIGTADVDASTGLAVFSPTTPLTVGSHSITASFGATTNFVGSNSPAITQKINSAKSATTLSLPDNPAVYGATVDLVATVTPVFPAAGIPTGTVQFFDGGASIGTANVDPSTGIATLNPATPLSVGDHKITATFTAATGFAGSSASAQTQTITASDTQTVLAPVPTPSIFGQALTFQATVSAVSPGAGVPTGTVTFYDGATAIGTAGVNPATGVASFTTTTPLSVGTHQISAAYNTTLNYKGSASAAQTQTVTADGTTITVTSSSALVGGVPTSVFSEPVVFTAQVQAQTPGTPFPTGTVTFFDNTGGGQVQIGTADIDPKTGQAAFTPAPPLGAGTHSITANFGATSNYGGSTSLPVTQVVNPDDTSVTVSSSSALVNGVPTAVFSEPVVLTAVVTPAAPGASITTGLPVTFFDGTVQLGTGSVGFNAVNHDYEATFTTTGLAIGTHNISAQFAASADYNGSTSAVMKQVVTVAPTTTTVTTSSPVVGGAGLSVFGESVTITATVSAAPGVAVPPGTVTIKDTSTGKVLATVAVDLTGQATFVTSALSVTTHNLVAVYHSTSAAFKGSTSPAFSQVVVADDTTVLVTTQTNPSGLGDKVTVSATVSANAPGSGTPTGTATFVNQTTGQVLGSNIPLVGGVASVTTSGFVFGSNNIVVTYSGSSSFNTATGTLTQKTLYGTTTSLTSSENPSFDGDPVTFTSTVAPGGTAPAGSPTPTGSVTFYDGGVPLATVGLDGTGTATFTTAGLAEGMHAITARYSGDGSFYGQSSSAELDQGVFAPAAALRVIGFTRPQSTASGFAVAARLYDANGLPIKQMGGKATITEVSGPDGGFTTPKSVSYVKGRFRFGNLHVRLGGFYTLRISFGSLSVDVKFSVSGRVG